jgi:conjugative transposon TraN protein
MTTNIIFPYRIEKADIGSPDVIGHKPENLENVLLLKANRKNFVPTNLSVYTSDGKFYSFIVRYNSRPDTLNLSFSGNMTAPLNEALLDSDAKWIEEQEPFLNKNVQTQEIKTALKGIYIKDQLMWFKIEIENGSQIDFNPEFIKFYVEDRHTAKRTAAQETELLPRWREPNKIVLGEHKTVFIFGFPAFTIPRQKKLVIHLSEKNGGRDLLLPVKSKVLLKARALQ